jgi:tetratricopeptide (TPR) repeat protein
MSLVEGTADVLILPSVRPPLAHVRRSDTREALATAESLAAESKWQESVDALADVKLPSASAPDLALRVLHCEGWARMYLGQLEAATALCERARALSESSFFDDVDRAESAFRLGACRIKSAKVSNAVSLFSEALRLTERGGVRGDRVRARAFEWRARCYALQRDWDAAQADAEHAVELAEALEDTRLEALATMQCSVIAERRGNPRLARFYAEQARHLAAECGDRQTEARLLNNLGGLCFLLGEVDHSVAYVKEAFAVFLEIGADADAAQAVSSLAQIHLRSGSPDLAAEQANHALSILGTRDDFLEERGNAHLVLGRAQLALGDREPAIHEFAAAEALFQRIPSTSLLAAAWMAQGDWYAQGGCSDAAAALYRRAANALQDFHF